jgi:hypothetical protein
MRMQPHANYESPGRESNLGQPSSWPELLSSGELSKYGKPLTMAGRETKLDIPLKSPWFYLALILMIWLLLL